MKPLPANFFTGPIIDVQTGRLLPHALKYFQALETKTPNLTTTGKVNSLDIVNDGSTYGRTLATALTVNQVDLSKVGVIGPLGSAKINQNVMFNYSNNATADSIDNGVNATVRVYGPGGVGTTWHQIIGNVAGPEIAAFSGAFAYSTDVWVYYDGSYHVTTTASDALPDGVKWAAKIHTVAAGGGGGTSGGGGSGGGEGGRIK